MDGPSATRARLPNEPPAARSVFVGRERELAELEAGLEGALAGEGGLILLTGEPGIGKTRLAEAVSSTAESRGARVLWGRCWEDGGAPAYWPWMQIIRSHVRDCEPAGLASELGVNAGAIAQMVPELRELLPGLPVPTHTDEESDRFALFDATAGVLRHIASDRPLVLVVDDLHAADPASLLLLRFVARELRRSPVLAVGTYRSVEARSTRRVADLMGRLAREGRTLEIEGLTRPQVGQLIEAATGEGPLERIIAAVHDATGGNPFFVTEVVSLLAGKGRLAEGAIARLGGRWLPEGARQAIARRVALLSGESAELLTRASVAGREFSLTLLERITGLTSAQLLDALGEATRAGIVAERAPVPGRYGFAHALIRETLYAELEPAERLDLHRRAGEALESLYRDDPEPHLAELAHHFCQAAPAGDAGRALRYSERAAHRAMRQLAYEEAATHYERALEMLDIAETRDDTRRLELLLALAGAQGRAGDTARRRETALRAGELARGMGSPEGLARAALALGAGSWASSMGAVDEVVRSHLAEALVALGPADSALRLRLLARLGIELQFSDEHERTHELTREALETARRLRDPAALGWALTHRHHAAVGDEHPRERLALSEEIIDLGDRTGRRQLALWGHLTRVVNLVELGKLHAAEVEAGTVARLSEELRLPSYRWYLAIWKAMRALTEGRLADAERLSLEAFEVGRPIHGESAGFFYAGHLMTLRLLQGRVDEVIELFEGLVEQERTSPDFRAILANLYAQTGRLEEARREFERFASRGFDLPRNFMRPMFVATLASACVRLGDIARAPALYELLLPLEDRYVIGGALGHDLMGPAALHLGMLAATMGRFDDAERHFDEALSKGRRIGQRAYVALTQLEYARSLVARAGPGDEERAQELLAHALAAGEQVGMRSLMIDANELARRAAERRCTEAGQAVFRRQGDFWEIAYGTRAVRLKDSRGLRHLAMLLANPNREISALELAGGRAPETSGRSPERGPELESGGLGAPDELIDAEARAAYRRRLEELEGELAQAEDFNDPERAARAREELGFLAAELARATGLGGAARKAPAPAERARMSVTKAIRQALRRLIAEHQPLGAHLESAVRTGTFCCYLPGPDGPARWQV